MHLIFQKSNTSVGSRLGVQFQDSDEYLYGPAFGAGIHYNAGGLDMQVDYGYRWNRFFDANHIITVKVGF